MRISFHTGDLHKALKSINCLPTASVPGCDQFLVIHADEFEGVMLTRTGQNGRVTFDCPAEVNVSGSVIISFTIFFRIISALPKEMINIEVKDGKLCVKGSANRKFQQPTIAPEDACIPELKLPTVSHSLTIPANKLCDLFKRCGVAVRTDAENVDTLGGVGFRSVDGKLAIFATDRRRIHYYHTGIEAEGVDAMLPAPMVDAAKGMFSGEDGNLLIEFDERSIQFAAGGNRFISPKASKLPPNLAPVLALASQPDKKSTFEREAMMIAVKTAMPLSVGAGEMRKLSLRFLEDGIELCSESNGAKFEQTIPAVGDGFYVEVNAGYFEEWLEAAHPGPITIGYKQSNIALFCETEHYTLFLSTLRPD